MQHDKIWQFRVGGEWINEDDWVTHVILNEVKFINSYDWSNYRLMIVCRDWFSASGICPVCYENCADVVFHFEDHLTNNDIEVDIDDRLQALSILAERNLARQTDVAICHCGRAVGHVCAPKTTELTHIDCLVCGHPIRLAKMQYHLFICNESMDLCTASRRKLYPKAWCRICFKNLSNHKEGVCVLKLYNMLRLTQTYPCCFICMREVRVIKLKAHMEICSGYTMLDLSWTEIKDLKDTDVMVSLSDTKESEEFLTQYKCYCGAVFDLSICLSDHCKTHKNTDKWANVIGYLCDTNPDLAIKLMDNNLDELEEL